MKNIKNSFFIVENFLLLFTIIYLINQIINKSGQAYFPFMYVLFILILINNFSLGLILNSNTMYGNTSSIYPYKIYKSESSSNNVGNNVGGNDGANEDDGVNEDDKANEGDEASEAEESFEIEEIKHIEKLMKLSNNAMILDEKLPYSQKDKNSHLNALRKDSHVKEIFEGKTPTICDLP